MPDRRLGGRQGATLPNYFSLTFQLFSAVSAVARVKVVAVHSGEAPRCVCEGWIEEAFVLDGTQRKNGYQKLYKESFECKRSASGSRP